MACFGCRRAIGLPGADLEWVGAWRRVEYIQRTDGGYSSEELLSVSFWGEMVRGFLQSLSLFLEPSKYYKFNR